MSDYLIAALKLLALIHEENKAIMSVLIPTSESKKWNKSVDKEFFKITEELKNYNSEDDFK